MDWYYGSGVGVNDYLIPRDQDLLDRHPSPEYWSNWEISANEGCNSAKQFFIMDFFEERFNNQIELEPSLHDKDQSRSSNVCARLREQSFQQTALSSDPPNFQLQDLPRFELMNDSFLDSVPEDLQCVDVENLHKSINISPENQCSSTPGTLQKETTDSEYVSSNSGSKDCPVREAPPAKVLDPFEQCSRDDGMHEQSSLDEFILKDLEMVIGQFTERTRLCFRDALYRLARNTEQHHEMLDQNEDPNILKPRPHRDHNDITRCQDKKSMELATNNIDRIIASLMFKSMEFNIHDPALTPSATSSESLNKEEKSCYSYSQELLTNAQIPRFGPSNQLRNIGSYTTCEDPVKQSFMLGFEMCDSDHYNRL
ncbi:hypothetical protein LR48_Vigan05g088600 [Vigna angularis]|uniref:Protein LNK3 n=2 Tax=Phaseolus angularis TaxID=3914 RepID=A0A0L9UL29_PHAAN|nr:hypothetical protein LR48_Vigan05g088600 [Vigna angularis]BAT92738.1 hypothetical protein VIGAN_07155800 [Vigna angularis var. angularis]